MKKGFGHDRESLFGRLVYEEKDGSTQEKQCATPLGDYGKVYDHMYESIILGEKKLVSDLEALTVMEILEAGFSEAAPFIKRFS